MNKGSLLVALVIVLFVWGCGDKEVPTDQINTLTNPPLVQESKLPPREMGLWKCIFKEEESMYYAIKEYLDCASNKEECYAQQNSCGSKKEDCKDLIGCCSMGMVNAECQGTLAIEQFMNNCTKEEFIQKYDCSKNKGRITPDPQRCFVSNGRAKCVDACQEGELFCTERGLIGTCEKGIISLFKEIDEDCSVGKSCEFQPDTFIGICS